MIWFEGFLEGMIVGPIVLYSIFELTGHLHHYIGLYCVW